MPRPQALTHPPWSETMAPFDPPETGRAPSPWPLGAVHRRDVGALQLLRHACPAGALPHRLHRWLHRWRCQPESRFRLVGKLGLSALRRLYLGGLPDADRGRLAGRPLSRHPSLDDRRRLDHRRGPHPARRHRVLRHHGGRCRHPADRSRRPRLFRRRPGADRGRHRLLQTLCQRHGGPTLRARRRSAGRRVHHLLHGHQRRRPARAADRRNPGRDRGLALGIRQRGGRHDPGHLVLPGFPIALPGGDRDAAGTPCAGPRRYQHAEIGP